MKREDWMPPLTPAGRRNLDRFLRAHRLRAKVLDAAPWMHWPPLNLAHIFWTTLIEEGPRATMAPRWGALTFSFLNDGYSPTVWHTVMQLLGHERYSGIWPGGAPRNSQDAEEKLARYNA